MFFISINIKYLNFTVAKFWVFFLVFTKLKPVTFFVRTRLRYVLLFQWPPYWFLVFWICGGFDWVWVLQYLFLLSSLRTTPSAPSERSRLCSAPSSSPLDSDAATTSLSTTRMPAAVRRRWSNSWERWRNAPRVEPRSCHCGTGLLLA